MNNNLYASNYKHSPLGEVEGARGLRNNNPLNIRRSDDKWKGLCEVQRDRQFFQFQSMEYGFRAAFIILRTYMRKYKLTTIRQIIKRWAPPEDGNNTENYIRYVCKISHLESVQVLDWNNSEQMVSLVQAMAYVECGVLLPKDTILNVHRTLM